MTTTNSRYIKTTQIPVGSSATYTINGATENKFGNIEYLVTNEQGEEKVLSVSGNLKELFTTLQEGATVRVKRLPDIQGVTKSGDKYTKTNFEMIPVETSSLTVAEKIQAMKARVGAKA